MVRDTSALPLPPSPSSSLRSRTRDLGPSNSSAGDKRLPLCPPHPALQAVRLQRFGVGGQVQAVGCCVCTFSPARTTGLMGRRGALSLSAGLALANSRAGPEAPPQNQLLSGPAASSMSPYPHAMGPRRPAGSPSSQGNT